MRLPEQVDRKHSLESFMNFNTASWTHVVDQNRHRLIPHSYV